MVNHRTLHIYCLTALLSFSASAQEESATEKYHWPTDASKFLTSTFGEYRARRFHTGMDVRTWGKTGYRCFAVRSGYVWRILVSPYGYGRAVYLKLDTGEIAVYAHLLKFIDEIQQYVEDEQKRTGKYRVDLFLKPGTLPVTQGDVIAYTGQTGIGAPHLHFEIRDLSNRPTNPLLKGYEIPDKVSPIVRKISFTPLDAHSEINGDFRPIVVAPKLERAGQYFVPEPISIWGNIGIAVSSYDKSSSASRRFGVYSLTLIVDDVLRFHYKYDRIDFKNNSMVELERDYRLSRRKLGRFYKLYKDKHNVRTSYSPNKIWAGILSSASLNAKPNVVGRTKKLSPATNFNTGSLFPGLHNFRIEITDFNKNISTVSGTLKIGSTFDIYPVILEGANGELMLEDVVTYDLNRIEELNAFIYKNRRWEQLPIDWTTTSPVLNEKGGEAVADENYETAGNIFLPIQTSNNPLIIRFDSRSQFGVDSYPYYYVHAGATEITTPPQIDVNYDYYNDYVRIELTSNIILNSLPIMSLYPDRADTRAVPLHQIALKTYVGRIELSQLHGTEHPLLVTVENPGGEKYSVIEQFDAEKIKPGTSDRIYSGDKKLWINFWSNSLYDPIYTRIEIDSTTVLKGYDVTGFIYRVEPGDVLLRKGAFIHLQYPDSTDHPDKLGVYYKTRKGKWVFIDNKYDSATKSVMAKVLSFEEFALIRDEEAPVINNIRPTNQAGLKNPMPRISVNIRDELSGIKNENDVEIRLDNKKLITEYDPERRLLTYQVKDPLAKGRHDLIVMAIDKSRNVAILKSWFRIE